MVNYFLNLKNNHTNLYALFVSLLLAIWYNGISSLINLWLPNRGLCISLIMLILPVILFLMEDGKLNELYQSPNTKYPAIAGAVANSKSFEPEKFYYKLHSH